MSQVLEEMPGWAEGSRQGRREAYPYDKWFDGKPHELTSPEDFVQNIRTMAANIKRAAERRRIKVSVVHNGTVIIVRAEPLHRARRRQIDLDILDPEVAVVTGSHQSSTFEGEEVRWSNKPKLPKNWEGANGHRGTTPVH
jgi:hypothetical protein